MLKSLRSGLGFRVAMALALFAALCFMAPPAAVAFGHGPGTAHCLSHADSVHHGAHMASGDLDHGNAPAKHDSGCCGLFCLSALMPACEPSLAGLELSEAPPPQREAPISGRIPELLDRPPITVLSV